MRELGAAAPFGNGASSFTLWPVAGMARRKLRRGISSIGIINSIISDFLSPIDKAAAAAGNLFAMRGEAGMGR